MEKPDIVSENNKIVANCNDLVPVADIEKMILTIRGVQVMIDRDLAMLYGVETKVLNQAVKRNIERFPTDFMFQLTQDEAVCSRSQFVTLNNSRGHNIKYLPYVFTENGIAMLSGVLRSPTAVKVNIRIMRAFTATQRFFAANAQMFQRIEVIEYHQLELAPHQHNTPEENKQIKDEEGDGLWKDKPHKKCQKDTDARWTQKGGVNYFGYKNHIKSDTKKQVDNQL